MLYFEDPGCRRCGTPAGFDPVERRLVGLDRRSRRRLAPLGDSQDRWAACSRATVAGCNWLVPIEQAGQPSLSCRLTGAIPVSRDRRQRAAFAKAEAAKRRLVYQLLDVGLPIVGRADDPEWGLTFELLAGRDRVVTGHDRGVITLDLNETDDAFREQARAQLGEPYRTLLGHFRHEIGHYYWNFLVGSSARLEAARDLFGDERTDYRQAIESHYRTAPVDTDWGKQHVSAYAAVHPLEDWAETFAHYLHIIDTVQTAASYGVLVTGPVDDRTGRRDPLKAAVPSEDTALLEGFATVVADWLTLTMALNALSRSMGKDDLYPFDLSDVVVAKLSFVHARIGEAATRPLSSPEQSGTEKQSGTEEQS